MLTIDIGEAERAAVSRTRTQPLAGKLIAGTGKTAESGPARRNVKGLGGLKVALTDPWQVREGPLLRHLSTPEEGLARRYHMIILPR